MRRLVLATLCLSAACQTAVEDVPQPAPLMKSSAKISTSLEDLCASKKADSADDKFLTGRPVERVPFVEAKPSELSSFVIKKENMIEDKAEPSKYNYVLIPVGYDSHLKIRERMEEDISSLKYAFDGLDMHFSYLDTSAPVDVDQIGKIISVDRKDVKLLREKIEEVHPVDGMAFVINGEGKAHARALANRNLTQFTGEVLDSLYQTGHVVSLGDGYKRRYVESGLDSVEFFLDKNNLVPEVRDYATKMHITPTPTNYSCDGKRVYTYVPDSNIMRTWMDDDTVLEFETKGKQFFTPIQKVQMKAYIDQSNSLKTFTKYLK